MTKIYDSSNIFPYTYTLRDCKMYPLETNNGNTDFVLNLVVILKSGMKKIFDFFNVPTRYPQRSGLCLCFIYLMA